MKCFDKQGISEVEGRKVVQAINSNKPPVSKFRCGEIPESV